MRKPGNKNSLFVNLFNDVISLLLLTIFGGLTLVSLMLGRWEILLFAAIASAITWYLIPTKWKDFINRHVGWW